MFHQTCLTLRQQILFFFDRIYMICSQRNRAHELADLEALHALESLRPLSKTEALGSLRASCLKRLRSLVLLWRPAAKHLRTKAAREASSLESIRKSAT